MNTAPSFSIVVVVYSELDFIPGLCASLGAQTVQPASIVFVDNSSDERMRKAIQEHCPRAHIHSAGKNLDFSRGVNVGISKTTSDFVLLLNPDMKLEPTMIAELMKQIQTDDRIGALAPKLRRLEREGSPTRIDSMGIATNRSRRFWNRGEGEEDRGQYDTDETFGIAGTAILFRRTALNDIATHGGGTAQEYFDEDFVAYKDDVDLSYRLRHRGWNIGVVPSAVADHQRTAREQKQKGLHFDRSQKSLRVRGNSLRNHWFCIIKNEPLMNILLDFPWIFWYEFRKFAYVLCCEPSTLNVLPSAIRLLPNMLRKRRAILSSSRCTPRDLRAWFHSSV